jgi:two-component system sensor histidine kinase FlrB
MPSSFQRLRIKDNAIVKTAESQILNATFRSLSTTQTLSNDQKVTPESIEQLQRDSTGLNQAFKQFSELSNEILNSYTDLEQRVESLNEELRVVSGKRLNDFEQKNTIAARLQSLLSILPSGVILLDGKGLISEVNPVAEKLLGNQLVGTQWFQIVNQKFAVNASKTHESVLNDGRRLHVATCPLEFESGQLIVLTDISSMHRLQSSVDRNKRLAIVGHAMSTLSHQLRTPLSTALLYVSHLQSNAFSETQKKDMARKLQGRLQQMNAQIDDMLLFAGGGQEQASRVNINQWIASNKEQIEDLFKLSQVEGEVVTTSADSCEIFVNEHAFGEAIYNLLVNACDAVSETETKKVLLKVQSVNNYLVLQVSDSGAGISDDMQDELFDPFITGKNSGTGLGLAIVQAVITSSKGYVNWRNLKNSGAEFTVLLPLVQDLHSHLEELSDADSNTLSDKEDLHKNRSNVATNKATSAQQVEGQ